MSPDLANNDSSARIPPRLVGPQAFPVWPTAILGAVLVTGMALLYWFNPTQSRFYPYCLFHQTTGLLCPGCGSLRALHHLLHGHWLAALHSNVLLVLALPMAGAWGVRVLWGRARGVSTTLTLPAAWLWTGLVVLLVFGIVRNLPFAPLTWLAP